MNNKKKSTENPHNSAPQARHSRDRKGDENSGIDSNNDPAADAGGDTPATPPSPPKNEAPRGRFDPSRFRAPQSFAVAATPVLTTVRIGKPTKEQFARVNPDEDRRFVGVSVIESKEDGIFLVDQSCQSELGTETKSMALYEAVTRQGSLFIWPANLPGPDGKLNPWHESMQAAIDLAMTRWVRIAADMDLGGYRTLVAQGEIPEPVWPSNSFEALLEIAFKGRIITSLDHPIVKKLWGR